MGEACFPCNWVLPIAHCVASRWESPPPGQIPLKDAMQQNLKRQAVHLNRGHDRQHKQALRSAKSAPRLLSPTNDICCHQGCSSAALWRWPDTAHVSLDDLRTGTAARQGYVNQSV